MKSINVTGLRHAYRILVGKNLAARTGEFMKRLRLGGKVCVVTQRPVARYHLKRVIDSLCRAGFRSEVYLIPDSETAKSEKVLFGFFRYLLRLGFERGDSILALGGGVTGDLAGFAASIYMRGIAFVNLGTTLLAQVDSAIGGKTGINLAEGKNLVGSFYPPRLVLSDLEFLRTLPARQFKASLAEVVKYGMIRDPGLFERLENRVGEILAMSPGILEDMVTTSSRIKAGAVSRDEFETKGERVILNYGHTFGHAFEQLTGYGRLLHGEAVSLGMTVAARLAGLLGWIPGLVEVRQRRLLEQFGLPVSLKPFRLRAEAVIRSMAKDKKKSSGKIRFVLPRAVGRVSVCDTVQTDVLRASLRQCGAQ